MRIYAARFLIAIGLSLPLVSESPAEGAVIRVPGNAVSIQSGINQAADGDTIIVAAGTYSGAGNEGLSLFGKKILLTAASGPQATLLVTTDTLRTIVCVSGEDSLTIIEGFTISGGYETVASWTEPARGGIRIENSSPVFRNCIIRDCYADDGGGIYVLGGSARFEDCVITNNQALIRGGGAYCDGDDIRFMRCAFTANRVFGPFSFWMASGGALQNYGRLTLSTCDIAFNRVVHESNPPRSNDYALAQGGGLYSLAGDVTIDSCRLLHNSAGIGGAIISGLEPIRITHSLVYNNIADQYGAVITLASDNITSGQVMIVNNTFACNYSGRISSDGIAFLNNPTELSLDPEYLSAMMGTAQPDPAPHTLSGNIFAFNGSTPVLIATGAADIVISHNDVWHTVSGPNYGGTIADPTGSDGNIAADPLFCDVSDSGFTIDITSPCFQAGENGVSMGAFDVACVNYNFDRPKQVILALNEATAVDNQARIDSVVQTLVPWDTLVLTSTLPRVEIDNLTITTPVYVKGPGTAGPGAFVLTENYNLGQRAVAYIRQFCVLDNLIIEAYHNVPQIRGFYAINSSLYPAIITNCRLTAWELDPAVASFDGSLLIRNCELVNGVSAFGRFDQMASYNYWNGCIDHACVEDAIQTDSLFFSGRIIYAPLLTDIPTGLDNNNQPNLPLPKVTVSQNYPNPFNAATTMSFTLSEPAFTRITVINLLGETVAELLNKTLHPGEYRIVWDGRNQSGDEAASGIYFMRVETGSAGQTIPMILIK